LTPILCSYLIRRRILRKEFIVKNVGGLWLTYSMYVKTAMMKMTFLNGPRVISQQHELWTTNNKFSIIFHKPNTERRDREVSSCDRINLSQYCPLSTEI
jgi:hypothetical protein